MNKTSIATKLKKLANKQAKVEVLTKEIEQLENEIADVKNKELNRLTKQYFAAESDEKRTELEVKIKALMRE